MSRKWVVVGVSGATCSGKSTLANKLRAAFPGSISICQDDYFLPVDSPFHTKVEALGHLNWEIMTALDMDSMRTDVHHLLSQDPAAVVLPSKAKQSKFESGEEAHGNYPFILILEGFLLLNDQDIFNLCNLRYYLTLSKEQCWDRRRVRVYDPPDVPGYFDQIVWPEYLTRRDEVLGKDCVTVIDGMDSTESISKNVIKEIQTAIQRKNIN